MQTNKQLNHARIKHVFTVLLILCNLSLFSQKLELIGGVNKNIFYDFKDETRNSRSTYNSEVGYSVFAAIEDIKTGSWKWRFTLGYEKYGGEIYVHEGSLGMGYSTQAKMDKSIVSVGVYPFNFKILDKIDFNIGFEIAKLIQENVTGTRYAYGLHGPNYTYNLDDKNHKYNANMYFGLRARIAYDFNLSEKIAISPQYAFYFGASSEFRHFPEYTASMRHFFGIGIQWNIK